MRTHLSVKCTINVVTHDNDVPSGSEALIVVHVPLVGYIVRETMARVPSHVDRDDLSSAGLAALVQAAHSYDPDRGVPFNRYASTRIRGAILDELRSIDWASRSVRRRARELDATRSQLATVLGRSATTAEVAQASGMSTDEVSANEEDVARAQVLSLHASEDDSLGDNLVSSSPTPEAIFEHRERLTYMTEAIAELPERLRHVVEQYFLAERPMAEIAATLGVTESRVSQMRTEALSLVREGLAEQYGEQTTQQSGRAAAKQAAYNASLSSRSSFASRLSAVPRQSPAARIAG